MKAERKEFLKSYVRGGKKPPVFSDLLCVYDFLLTIALKLRCYTRLYIRMKHFQKTKSKIYRL